MKLKLKESFDPRNITKVFGAINDGIENDDDKEALQKYLQQIITYCKGLADDYNVTVVLDEQEEDSVYEAEDSATQVGDIPKKPEYKKMVTPDFKVGKKLQEAYNYIGADTEETGVHGNNTHMEHTYTVYDCFGEVDTFKTREEAERFIKEHKNDDVYTEEYGCTDPDFRIEEDDIEVMNKKIVVKDDLE